MKELYDYCLEKKIITKNKLLENAIKLNRNEDKIIKILSDELIELLLEILKRKS